MQYESLTNAPVLLESRAGLTCTLSETTEVSFQRQWQLFRVRTEAMR